MQEAKKACLNLNKSDLTVQELMSKMMLDPHVLSSTSILIPRFSSLLLYGHYS